MKLHTSILPRRDGSLFVTGLDGAKYSFAPDESGMMACEVPDQATVTRLLSLGDFFPADEADNENALALLKAAAASEADALGAGVDGNADPDGDDPVDENALPVEAHTEPSPAPAAKKPRAKHAA